MGYRRDSIWSREGAWKAVIRVLALWFLFSASPAPAGQLVMRPLAETLELADQVFVGRVLKSERQDSEAQSVIRLSVRPLRILRGPVGDEAVEMIYSRVIPLIRNDRGEVIGSFSPVIDGSGRELAVKEGEEWLFLVRGSGGKFPASLLRVEPTEQADRLSASGK